MEVKLNFNNKTYPLTLPSNPSVSNLTTAIFQCVQVHHTSQKIIMGGKIISNIWKPKQKLAKFKVQSGTKLLLIATDQSVSELTPQTKRRRPPPHGNTSKSALATVSARAGMTSKSGDHFDQLPNQEIMQRGPPPGCMSGGKTALNFFPDTPFIVYDASGVVCRLNIEQESVWIEQDIPDGIKERIFLTDISKCITKPIEKYEDEYVMLFLITTTKMIKIFYFIPLQYSKCCIEYLQKSDK